jgi:hypothetical protein
MLWRCWKKHWQKMADLKSTQRSGQPVHQRHVHRGSARKGIQLSMDGKRSWRDNVFVERLWRSSVKYEEVHLNAYESVSLGTRVNCCVHGVVQPATPPVVP